MSTMCRRLVVPAMLLSLAACSPRGHHGEIARVGCDTNFMPFEFKMDDQYTGFDIDLWDAVARDLGIKYRLQPMDFNGLIPALQTGSIDVALAGMTITAERMKAVDFSYPYYRAGLLIMVRTTEKGIRGAADLADRVVATKLGTTSAAFAKNIKTRDVKLFPNIDGAYLELQAQGADAVIFDSPAILHYVKTQGEDRVKAVGPLYQGQTYGIAFPPGSALRKQTDIALLRMMESGAYDSLYTKWFGALPR